MTNKKTTKPEELKFHTTRESYTRKMKQKKEKDIRNEMLKITDK